ncbi:hypothetical protein [Kitasatospora indigofera]
MTTWFRTYDEDEALWLYVETDGWAARPAGVRGRLYVFGQGGGDCREII